MRDDTNWTKKKPVLTSWLSRANCCAQTPRQQQREAVRWFFFFFQLWMASWQNVTEHFWLLCLQHMNHTFHKVCQSLLRQHTHPLKNVELWRGRPDEKRNGGSLWCCGVKAEWHPRRRTHTVSRLESSNFFSLSLQRKKLLEKNPSYACYQRLAFGLYRLSFRKRQRRRYFTFQRFFLQCLSRLGLEMFLEVCRTSRILLEYRRSALA